jgi:hypothetical protein
MNEIQLGGSWLQNSDLRGAAPQVVLTSICEHSELGMIGASRRIWELLETPQTVVSLCRVLSREHHQDPQAYAPAVESLLTEFFECDLIQMSPDT